MRGWWRAAGEAARRLAGAVRDGLSPPPPATPPRPLERLARVRLTDTVARTLLGEYAAHLTGDRGGEETGWFLLGLREGDEATILATLPAGAERSAGAAHVGFNSTAQAVASRVVRRADRRLTSIGVAHTHPGSLRHPSDGDYRGDSRWVGNLRGREGVFGIGTADARDDPGPGLAWQPHPHQEVQGGLCWSWYALGEGDRGYRPLPVEVTLGPDLALPLRPVWEELETNAVRLERLARQLARVSFGVVEGRHKPALAVEVPLTEPGEAVQVLLEGKEVRYVVLRGGDAFVADLPEPRVDQGVFLLLAELAARVTDEEPA